MRRNDQSTSPIILRFLSTKCGIDLKRGSVKIHKMCHLRQGRGVPRDQPVSVGTAPCAVRLQEAFNITFCRGGRRGSAVPTTATFTPQNVTS